jgi:hypothetical protein
MRTLWPKRLVLVAVGLLVVTACDTTQPPSAGARTASLTVEATADGFLYNCYDIWQDTSQPPDGIADVDTGFKICDVTGIFRTRAVPWRYSLSISLIPAGATTEQVVKSVNGVIGSSIQQGDHVDDFVSLTPYDPTVDTAPDRPFDPENNFYFKNGKQVSVGSPVYIAANNINDVGTSNILTVTPSFDFTVNRGDTIVVRGRKQSLAQSPAFITFPIPKLTLSASLTVGGAGITPVGTATSAIDDTAGISFSYTVQ